MLDVLQTWTKTVDCLSQTEPRPGLHPIPGTKPITIEAMILPPVIYYIALLWLPPAPPDIIETTTMKVLRNSLALFAGVLFFRLPMAHYIPQSIGLNYQLSLVGIYGGCRVVDAFFISPYLFNHIPRRVRFEHRARFEAHEKTGTQSDSAPTPANSSRPRMAYADSSPSAGLWDRRPSLPLDQYVASSGASSAANVVVGALSRTLSGPQGHAVDQIERTERGWPHTFVDRAAWALELEMSMRGIGFTWTTADVRHTRKTWLPTIWNRLHSVFVHALPTMILCFVIIRSTYDSYLTDEKCNHLNGASCFDTQLSMPRQLLLTAALGAFLMSSFSFAHSAFAIMCSPLAPSPLAFFPPLYTTRIFDITSVRGFWSYGWHRLFARLFLVYGVWPGQFLERKLMGKRADEAADVGKVVGGFLSSAVVHSFSVRSVLGGSWRLAKGEAVFFAANGLAVVLEEMLRRSVTSGRKARGSSARMPYDKLVGRVWWITILLFSGRNFARGWVNASLVREMAGR